MGANGAHPDDIRVVHNGHEHALAAQPVRPGTLRTNAPFFLFVGTSDPRKGFDIVRAAWGKYRDEGGDAALVTVGVKHVDGVFSADPLAARAREHLVDLGHVTDGEIRWLYANCAGFLAASQYEGFDLPVLEALANGATVFASDIEVHRELFAEAVEIFTDQSELSKLLHGGGKNTESPARDVCLDRFSWTQSAKELDVILDELAVGKSR